MCLQKAFAGLRELSLATAALGLEEYLFHQEVLSVQEVSHLTMLPLAAGSSLMCSGSGKL